jgi:hypothetical protein
MDYVHNALGAPVKDQNINSKRDPAITIGKTRQAALQVVWKRLHAFLQSGRQSAIAF